MPKENLKSMGITKDDIAKMENNELSGKVTPSYKERDIGGYKVFMR